MRRGWMVVWLLCACVRQGFVGSGEPFITDAGAKDGGPKDSARPDLAHTELGETETGVPETGVTETGVTDASNEGTVSLDPCTPKTADGIALNPGCDPQVAASGLTAISNDPLHMKNLTMVVSGTRWWIFDPAVWDFTEGGKDLAARLRQESPDCGVKTADGTELNPGCDPDVQTKGPTAMASLVIEAQPYWFLVAGEKYWFYDPSSQAFVDGGKDLADRAALLSPTDCTKKATDGTPLNPGCDTDVQSSGFTAVTDTSLGSSSSWAGVNGKKWWIFDPSSGAEGAFVDASGNMSVPMQALEPSCSTPTSDGITLNAGCDPDVQSSGFSAATSVSISGIVYWLGVNKTKWWLFEATPTGGTFVAGGKDVATMLRMGITL